MALTAAQRAALLARIGTGVKSTTVDGLTVNNDSVSDAIKALQYDATCQAAEDTTGSTRPFRLNIFKSPGGIYGSY